MDFKSRPKGVCYAYASNRHCKYKNCKFSHDQQGFQGTRAPRNQNSNNNNNNNNNTNDLLTWKRHLQQNGRPHYKPTSLKHFFQTALKLISIDPNTQQDVIRSLATEAGLRQLLFLVERDNDKEIPFMDDNNNDATKIATYTNEVAPFLAVVTHADVLASLVLEQAVVTIYNFLYGVAGRRAGPFLEFLADVVQLLVRKGEGGTDAGSGSGLDPDPVGACIDAALSVFWHIVEKNSTAFVQEPLKQIAMRFQALCETAVSPSPQAQTLLDRLLRRFELVSNVSVRPAQKSSSSSAAAPAAFIVKKDPPGGRHDNDHVDICNVKILPTFQEILSSRTEYLPVKDPRQWHEGGIAGLLDRHFRLLREDTVGQLRDAIHAELQSSTVDSRGKKYGNNQTRTHVYKEATIKRLGLNRFAGLRVLVDFPQPSNVRGKTKAQRRDWWEASKRLQTSALVCLVRSPGFAIFCTVAGPDWPRLLSPDGEQRQQPAPLKSSLWEDENVASIIVELAEPTEENRLSVMGCHGANDRGRAISLVEFPGVLLPSFQPTLLALQNMKANSNLPMPEILVADAGDTADYVDVPPPAYASRPGFGFNLQCLMDDRSTLEVRPSQPVDLERLQQHSTLDAGQAKALVHTLQRRVGLIQGPPGTGKSYTGVALIKVLLANRNKIRQFGPIICLLEDVLESKITNQVIRIGSQSKSEILQSKNLREVSRNVDLTRFEKRDRYNLQTEFDGLEQQFDTLKLESFDLRKYLAAHDPERFLQLFGKDKDGFQRYSKGGPQNIIDSWLHSGKVSKAKPRRLRELEKVHVDQMTARERRILHDHWIDERRASLHAEANVILSQHLKTKRSYDDIKDEVNLRCLRDAHVVGITTTGLARNLNMLRRLQSKAILCEEAGEVLEAHMLTSLLPSVEHVILIGDHQQLRPQIQNYALSRESNVGQKYSLDLSLFERLVQPDDDSGGRMPFCTLETQRRMHPSIAHLVRDTLYPRLKDATSVGEYPEVMGMRKRLFWLDHRRLEGRAASDEAVSTSHWNDYEIDLTLAVVSHLLRQGVYCSGDIAVLTPYLGQLHRMRRRLSQSFTIALGERDQEDLDKAGFADEDTANKEEVPTSATVARSTVLQALRVATIDNFQGEEAKVVVISLVRSNNQNQCGFLRTPNRINVLLSRARHGMYIIGNSETSRGVEMWAQVLDILDKAGNLGPTLDLQCPRHPDSPIAVSEPEHFTQFSPEGGCNLLCGKRLQCGHPCKQKCHSELLHQAVYCLETCPRPLKGCTHACPKPCGDPCPKRCPIKVFDAERVLPCGHSMATLPCWQAQDLSTVKCPMPVKKQVRHCDHEVTVACHIDLCRSNLPCGHSCNRECWQCTVHGAEGIQVDHGTCTEKCGRPYTTYCPVQCGHSRCPRKCSEPCAPCAVPTCLSACPHSACTMPCAAPCDHTPCSLRCDKVLSCGHRCPSLCGEVCPNAKYCQTCATDEIADTPVDFILSLTYREIDLDESPCIFPPCGHFLTVESMDGQMNLKKHYVMNEMGKPVAIASSSAPFSNDDSVRTCATCRGSLRSIARYGRLVRRVLLDEATKKFILYLNQAYVPMAEKLPQLIADLQNRELGHVARLFRKEMAIKIQGPPDHQVELINSHLRKCGSTRWQDMNQLRSQIVAYYKKVDLEEQPFTQVWSRVEDARRRKRTTGQLAMDESVLQTKGSIQALSLLIRLDTTLLGDFFSLHKRVQLAQSTLEVNLRANRQQCQALIDMAASSRRVLQQIEGNLFQAQLCALERQAGTEPAQAENLLQKGKAALDAAKLLCEQHPGQARGLDGEIEGTEQMLCAGNFYAPITSEERVAIVKAMAREFLGTGHWYYCENGHPFTIGECGGAVQLSRCPECGSPVGGQRHRTATGVTRATDLEEDLGRLQIA
ncbi:putative NF-X1 finger and helicase domain protein [Aspergillus candidus]|uniref:P-loop containing nucleoside triphosphate hydrolase protein n=1 Tax=Aspergillus candidus TaxID=41067 RepID=A0A2I2FN14_ASPCN|nr:P-loop containing nucleoside triphosphate hydrolase protein [Aspergillus candidus]PLB42026.1 P-loop containing nucleoside triphosphate hydrolase protein [Aspergillus candidus]